MRKWTPHLEHTLKCREHSFKDQARKLGIGNEGNSVVIPLSWLFSLATKYHAALLRHLRRLIWYGPASRVKTTPTIVLIYCHDHQYCDIAVDIHGGEPVGPKRNMIIWEIFRNQRPPVFINVIAGLLEVVWCVSGLSEDVFRVSIDIQPILQILPVLPILPILANPANPSNHNNTCQSFQSCFLSILAILADPYQSFLEF